MVCTTTANRLSFFYVPEIIFEDVRITVCTLHQSLDNHNMVTTA